MPGNTFCRLAMSKPWVSERAPEQAAPVDGDRQVASFVQPRFGQPGEIADLAAAGYRAAEGRASPAWPWSVPRAVLARRAAELGAYQHPACPSPFGGLPSRSASRPRRAAAVAAAEGAFLPRRCIKTAEIDEGESDPGLLLEDARHGRRRLRKTGDAGCAARGFRIHARDAIELGLAGERLVDGLAAGLRAAWRGLRRAYDRRTCRPLPDSGSARHRRLAG